MKILGIEIENDLKPLTEKVRGALGGGSVDRGSFGLTAQQIIAGSDQRSFGLDSPEARAFFTASEGTPSDIRLTSKLESFSRNTWVHKCVMKNAEMIAALPFLVRRNQTELKNHPVLQLVRRPNPYFSENELWQMTLAALNLYGEAFWLLNRESFDGITRAEGASVLGYPKSIWTVHPSQMEAVLSSDKQTLLAWRVSLPGVSQQDIDPNDVVQFRFPNIFNPWRGTSPLDAAALSVTADQASQKYNLGVFARGAIPAGILVTPGKLNPQQAGEVIAKFESRHRESHRPAILHSGLDYKETQMSNHDMEFKELRRMNREDILAAFGVPPVAVGLLEHASYANADMQMKLYWTGTLIPQGDLLCNGVKNSPLMREDPPEVVPEFDRSNVEVLQENVDKKLDTGKKFFEMGYTQNQINDRLELGMPKNPWGDTAFLSHSLTPVEYLIEPPEPAVEDPGDDEEEEDTTGADTDAEDEEEEDEAIAAGFSWERLTSKVTRVAIQHDIQKQIESGEEEFGVVRVVPKSVTYVGKTATEAADPFQLIETRVRRSLAQRTKAVTEKKTKKILSVIEKSKKNLRTLADGYIKQGTQVGIDQMNELLGTGFSLTDPDVIDFIESKIVLIVGIEDVTKDWIKATITNGLNDGLTIEEIADKIRDDYNFGPARALRIARTELASSINGGRYITMLKEGIEEHEWLTSRGKNVRKTHGAEEGIVMKIGERFPTTKLMFPGEPSGPPQEIINCRCITVPGEAKRMFKIDRDAYWERLFGGSAIATSLERRFGKVISKHFHNQRKAILKILLN